MSSPCWSGVANRRPALFFNISLAFFKRPRLSCSCRISRCNDSSWRSSSAHFGTGGELLLCFMDAGASRPSSWFFQLYNVGLHTPNFSATAWAVSRQVQNLMTPACFIDSGYLERPTLPTTAFLISGIVSRTQAINVPRLGYPSALMVAAMHQSLVR